MNEIKSIQKKFKLRVILAVIALILGQGSIWGGMILDIAQLSAIGLITSSGYVMALQ